MVDTRTLDSVEKAGPHVIGNSVPRAEDPPLVTGRARFVADVDVGRALSAVVVRSPVAHGRIVEVDISEALSAPGVVAVWTAEDVAADLGEIPRISPRLSETVRADFYLQPVIARERVRYVGEPLAIVVAEDRYRAEDAAGLVFPDIEPLPVARDPADPSGPELFPEGNEVQALHAVVGDAAATFASAPVVIEKEFEIVRHTAIPMETRGLTVEYRNGVLVIHGATKVPHWNRMELARQLGVDASAIVMRETAIGGGFGVRGEFYPEDLLIPWAAGKLQRSIRWIEDRREHFTATSHSRGQKHHAAIAGDERGNILALRTEFWLDLGAYVRTNGLRVPENSVTWFPGPYDIHHYDGIAHCVVTNRTPTATYRAPGGVECTFVRERLIDMFAERIGMDPIDLRRRNLIRPEQMPYERKTLQHVPAIVMDEGDFPKLFDKVVGSIDRDDVARRRSQGETVGIGVATFFERSGAGPSETGTVTVDGDGSITVRSGASSVGQGLRTVLAQIAAEELQLPVTDVCVEFLDTSETGAGVGSYGSRSTMMAGAAVKKAAQTLIARCKALAAAQLSSSPPTYREGRFSSPQGQLTLAEVAREAGGRVEVSETHEVASAIYDFGAHAAVASVDLEIGLVRLEKLVVGFDVGRAINPKLVEGQFVGAAVQGLGGALLERLIDDEDGNPLVTSLMDYLMPTASEVPPIEAIIDESHPTDHNPLGAKGAGEGGITGIPAAICGAISDAVSDAARITSFAVDPSILVAHELRKEAHT